jgi:hypothetical protein
MASGTDYVHVVWHERAMNVVHMLQTMLTSTSVLYMLVTYLLCILRCKLTTDITSYKIIYQQVMGPPTPRDLINLSCARLVRLG